MSSFRPLPKPSLSDVPGEVTIKLNRIIWVLPRSLTVVTELAVHETFPVVPLVALIVPAWWRVTETTCESLMNTLNNSPSHVAIR